jgi:Sulfotransferase family
MDTEAPIFIVGAARSGTTLLKNLLNRHPRISICGETHFHRYIYQRRRAFGDLSNPTNRKRAVDEYVAFRRLWFVTDRAVLREKLLTEATSYRAMFTCFVKYFADSQGKERWGEKTPQHTLFSQTLCDWYPHGIILHIIRDPRDVVASLQRMPWAAQSVVQNARRWLKGNLAAHRCSHRPQYVPVRYETLVTQPEQELARICDRLGEDYVPSMLEPEVGGASLEPGEWMLRARQAITTSQMGEWREALTEEEVSQIEWVIGSHMETFGYRRAQDSPSTPTIARGIGLALSDSVRTRLKHLPRILRLVLQPTKLR